MYKGLVSIGAMVDLVPAILRENVILCIVEIFYYIVHIYGKISLSLSTRNT